MGPCGKYCSPMASASVLSSETTIAAFSACNSAAMPVSSWTASADPQDVDNHNGLTVTATISDPNYTGSANDRRLETRAKRSEAGHVASTGPGDDLARAIGTCGRPQPETLVRIDPLPGAAGRS